MSEAKNISKDTLKYSEKAKELIKIAGKYAAKVKLKANLQDEATAWKVQKVLNCHYDGKMSKLNDAVVCAKKDFFAKVRKFNLLCLEHGCPTISNPEKLLDLLLSANRRDFYRRRIQANQRKNLVVSLQAIELEYQGRK